MTYQFTEADITEAAKKLINKLIEDRAPVSNPKLYLLGGQPGAGKSSISERLMGKYPNTIFINPDEYRGSHPQYEQIKRELDSEAVKETGIFSGAVTEKIRQYLSDKKYNLIIEGTFRTTEVPLRIAKEMNDKGYSSELHAIAVPKDLSYIGTLKRYFAGTKVATGRAVDKNHHDLVVDNLQKNLKTIAESKLFSSLHLHNRNKEIYTTENDIVEFLSEFEAEFDRELTAEEKKDLYQVTKDILASLEQEMTKGVTNLAGTDISKIIKEVKTVQENIANTN